MERTLAGFQEERDLNLRFKCHPESEKYWKDH
jgi:hypothetical protein